MKPLLESLRPAVRNLLLQKFDELEQSPDADPELEDVLEVEPTLTKQPSETGTWQLGPGSARPATGSKRPATGGMRPTAGGVKLPTGQKPPLAKSKELKAPSTTEFKAPPRVPKPSQSDAANIKVPV